MAVIDLRKLAEDSEIGGDGGVAVADSNGGLIGVWKREGEGIESPDKVADGSGLCGMDGLREREIGFLCRPPFSSRFRNLS